MHFDAADLSIRDREEVVRDIVWNSAVPLEVEHLDRERGEIELMISAADFGLISVQSWRSSAVALRRSRRLARDDSTPSVILSVQRRGFCTVSQEGRHVVFGTGDLMLVSSTRSFIVQADHHSPGHLVRIPAQLLALPEAVLRTAVAIRLGPQLPVAGVVGRYVADLATFPALPPTDAEHLARATAELVRALIFTVAGGSRRASESLDATLQLRLIDYLRTHWSEGDLTADRIGAAHHISARQVYRVLAAQGISLGDWLRERRLDACRRDLANPNADAVTVASVGRRWGFSNATNFGRAFKRAYGLTPREWRSLHQAS